MMKRLGESVWCFIASMKVADRIAPKADPLLDADFHLYQCRRGRIIER